MIVVATDDQRIIDAVVAFGGEAHTTSPDCATGSDRCWDLYSNLKAKTGREYDIIVNIQGDEPLVNAEHIDRLVEALQKDPTVKISYVTSVHCCDACDIFYLRSAAAAPIHREEDAVNRNVTKVIMDLKGRAIYFSRALIPHSK